MNIQQIKRSGMYKSASSDSLNKMMRTPSTDSLSGMLSKTPSNESLAKMVKNSSTESLPKMTRVASEQAFSSAIQTVIPDVPGMLVSMFLLYISNNSRMVMKRPSLLLHPKKIMKVAPVSVIGLFVNSDAVTRGVDTIGDHTTHLAAEVVLQALKLALACA